MIFKEGDKGSDLADVAPQGDTININPIEAEIPSVSSILEDERGSLRLKIESACSIVLGNALLLLGGSTLAFDLFTYPSLMRPLDVAAESIALIAGLGFTIAGFQGVISSKS